MRFRVAELPTRGRDNWKFDHQRGRSIKRGKITLSETRGDYFQPRSALSLTVRTGR